MNLLAVTLAALVVSAVTPSQVGPERGEPTSKFAYPASAHNQQAILGTLQPLLASESSAARIYYAGPCVGDITGFVYFPSVAAHRPVGSGLQAVKSIFRGDANVTVSAKTKRVIAISIGRVPTDILRTRLSTFRLAPLGQYNPGLAIGSLYSEPEVEKEMARLHLHTPIWPTVALIEQPAPGLPHLPSVMRDMTMDEILDMVATTFQGSVIYGICPNTKMRMYSLEFFSW